MGVNDLSFVFASNPSEVATLQDFIVKVPPCIQTAEDLFLAYEKGGNFPGYFGRNWDALLDCLRDFSWTTQRRVVIVHTDLPLLDHEEDIREYLEILEMAVNDWNRFRARPFVESRQDLFFFVEHELIVVFPIELEATVISILSSPSN